MKQKKNKTNQVVTWPNTTLFTIQELHRLNPKFVNITLRVRLTKAIESGKVVEVGSVPGEHGRPQKVFSYTPVTQLTFDRVIKEGMTPVDNYKSLIGVASATPLAAPYTTSGHVKFNVSPLGHPQSHTD